MQCQIIIFELLKKPSHPVRSEEARARSDEVASQPVVARNVIHLAVAGATISWQTNVCHEFVLVAKVRLAKHRALRRIYLLLNLVAVASGTPGGIFNLALPFYGSRLRDGFFFLISEISFHKERCIFHE